MPRCIVKLRDRYFDWSTVVDAPLSYAMSRGELEQYFEQKYGEEGLRDLPERLARVEQTGTSVFGTTAQEILSMNRAGDDGTCLTEDELLAVYAGPSGA